MALARLEFPAVLGSPSAGERYASSGVIHVHIIIVEDLEPDRKKLAVLINEFYGADSQPLEFSFYDSGEDFLAHYQAGSCDALFLDIILSGISGIETARAVREREPRLPIIFTTSEPDFALDGYTVHAMDYLVKPLKAARISWCLRELREYLATPVKLTISQIDGPGHSHTIDLPLDDIFYGQYHAHNIELHTSDGLVLTRLQFQDFTALLPHSGRFHVCGRNLVVNFSYVERVTDSELILKNGERLQFSRSHRAEVQNAFSSWVFSRSRKGGWA